jgi:AcrR family transcriptional regulator
MDRADRDEVRSRRQEYSEATQRALLDSATRLFAKHGFDRTSLDEVAARARVTKGAVYHHFSSKQSLFEAVADEMEQQTLTAILDAAGAHQDAWDGVVAGLETFLDRCLDPAYQRICFRDGPAVMGFEQWWQFGEEHVLGLMRGMLSRLRDDGLIELDEIDMLTELLYGVLSAGALSIARSPDPKATRREVRDVTTRLIIGLRPASRRSTRTTSRR